LDADRTHARSSVSADASTWLQTSAAQQLPPSSCRTEELLMRSEFGYAVIEHHDLIGVAGSRSGDAR